MTLRFDLGPWPWPWIFKVKYEICYISTKSGPIDTKQKANISIWTLGLKCDNGFDLGHDIDIWIFKVICDGGGMGWSVIHHAKILYWKHVGYNNDLEQDCSNSSVLAMELLQSWTKLMLWSLCNAWVEVFSLLSEFSHSSSNFLYHFYYKK